MGISIVTTLHSYVFSHEGVLYRFSQEAEIVGHVTQCPQCYLSVETGFKVKVDNDHMASLRAGIEELSKRLPV